LYLCKRQKPVPKQREIMPDDSAAKAKQPNLLDIPEQPKKHIKVIAPTNPVWTDNKARFIMRYLRYFVYITKHGTYIDGFAGPQQEKETDAWAAKLVLESEPRRLRHFHLCDIDKKQVARLEAMKAAQPTADVSGKPIVRNVEIYSGDFNQRIDDVLNGGTISEKEATFCLLDQRTFECYWSTVEKIAKYKKTGMKIELFYFLANGWFERAFCAQKDLDKLANWWGRSDWKDLRAMSRDQRRDLIVERMRNELGYEHVMPWSIYKRNTGGAVMYFMIHATDHPEGPVQMSRAYRNTVLPLEPLEQLSFELEGESKAPQSGSTHLASASRPA
jgi:three-Cys-motif partner protein